MREILYNKQEGRMNEEVASRMQDETRGELKGDVNRAIYDQMPDDVQEVDGSECGCAPGIGMEELVRKLEALCEDMAVVKGYIVALQLPLTDRCNTWVDGRTVQRVLHIHGRTLKAMRENGTMPYSQMGKRIYYNVEDMDGLLRKHYSKGSKAGGEHA